MNILERVSKLRQLMIKQGVDAYIIPSADNHQSEYVGEYFKTRAYISGFTGSAGTVVITKDDAGLWTDGRYFIQADHQLEGTGIRLFKMGEPGVPTTEEFLYNSIQDGGKLGFDGRVIAAEEGISLEKKLSEKNISIVYDTDLIDTFWTDRPAMSEKPAFLLDVKYAGESFSSKLARVREKMKESETTCHIITSLDDIAWLLNIRGDDVAYSPLVLSYSVITFDTVHLFIDKNKLGDDIMTEFAKENVIIHPYNDIYDFIKTISSDNVVMIDSKKINYAIFNNIPNAVKRVEKDNPTIMFKAIKNEIELENVRKSHIKDGIAFTKFMYWLKQNIGKIKITEISASDKLEEFRAQQEGFIGPSFAPISAYKEHAAMMHYSATEETDYELKAEHLYLTDTGGNYYEGTTDITRTLALGEISNELKIHFTAVARGMINLSMAKFLYGVRGYNLDVLARQPIWQLGIDYKCGTGHGVGYLLNIHEGPSGFRWQIVPSKNETAVMEPGMVITNEPGIYIENSHGIRLENELIFKNAEKNEFGQFMNFEVVTFIPIDLDALEPSELNKDERAYLNYYHQQVFEKISPYLTNEEKEWLKIYTREI
ncbi:aminopeptidase P family protein [Proteocatella sphenisci]|uniref:aminopeptidase P family protein n=1 Tax=Proteocatella sphenisci TaxID=181070 RepID=UPI00048CF88D|nr:aminopeptidase P family protein [Proteocatella sphenisci]